MEVVKITTFFKFGIISALVLSVIIILISALKTKRFFSCVILSSLQGVAAMFAVNALGLVTGLHLALNWYTLAASAIGGTPAVIGMIMLEIVFK